MNRRKIAILWIAACASLMFLGLLGCGPQSNTNSSQKQSLYDRVISAGKIRCGYVSYPPGCIKDPNTGKLTGIHVEALEKAAENLGLKVEWTEEVSWGSMIEGLQADRYDMIGAAIWANTTRGKVVDFSIPLFYSGIGMYVKKGDTRFKADNLNAANTSNVKISTIDGEMSDIITRSQFPLAQKVSLPQTSDVSQMFLELKQGRSDIVFAEPYIGYQFLKNNPDTVVNIIPDKPLRVFGNCYMFKRNETEFKTMLNAALTELLNSGYVDTLIDKYTQQRDALYRPAYPYRIEH